MDNLPAGIEIHGKSLRICFTYRGQRCREALKGVAITKPNIKFAERKRAVILHEITIGTFDYGVHFPGSKRAALFSPKEEVKTVAEAVDAWLAVKASQVREVSHVAYASKAANHIKPHLGEMLVTHVTKGHIEHLIYVTLKPLANSTIQRVIGVLHGVFASAVLDRAIPFNPMAAVTQPKAVKTPPDPFLKWEIDKIATTPTQHIQEVNQFVFSCWTGVRMSEAFALSWEDINQENWTIKIRRGYVNKQYGMPKNRNSARTLELLDPAIEVLRRQKELTYELAPLSIDVIQADNKTRQTLQFRPVFLKTTTGRPYPSDSGFRKAFFVPHMKAAGIRYRSPRNARHTFACQMLTALAPKAWIINQMGHASEKMFNEVYGKWLPEEAPQMARFISDLLSKSDQNAPPVPQKKEDVL